MNTILGFKNLEEEELEDNPCPIPLREKMSEFHDGLMQVMSISSLEEEDVEIAPKSDEKPSILSVIIKVNFCHNSQCIFGTPKIFFWSIIF